MGWNFMSAQIQISGSYIKSVYLLTVTFLSFASKSAVEFALRSPPSVDAALWSRIEKILRKKSHLIIHFPASSGVSKVSERANEWAQRRAWVKRAVWSKQTSERCERMSERTSEWPSIYVSILVCSRPQCPRRTDRTSYRDERTHLKNTQQ